MAYNSVADIILLGRLNLQDFPQTEIEKSILEADGEIDLRIPPLLPADEGYDRYSRRLSTIRQAHGYLTLHFAFKRLAYDTIAHASPGDPFNTLDMGYGAKTPEINTIADYYRKLSDDYREQAESLIKKCRYSIPSVRRPAPLSL